MGQEAPDCAAWMRKNSCYVHIEVLFAFGICYEAEVLLQIQLLNDV